MLILHQRSTRHLIEYKILMQIGNIVIHFQSIRDVKGAEGGTSEASTGAIANPGTSPTAKELCFSAALLPECPKKRKI